MTTILDFLSTGIAHHQAGRLAEAEQIYRQLLTVEPNCAEAWHLLGAIAHHTSQHKLAAECFTRVVELKPDFAEAHGNLGAAFHELGMLDTAIIAYDRAVALKPDLDDVHNNLGNALQDLGRLDEAIQHYRIALALRPDEPLTHYNLGNAFKGLGMLNDAVGCYRRALDLNPNCAEALNNLGNIRQKQGMLNEAMECYLRASKLNPNHAHSHNNLGTAFKDLGMLDRAAASFQRAVELKPDFAEAHLHLANVLKEVGVLVQAIATYRDALKWNPTLAEAHRNLGNALKDQDRLDEAFACYRMALQLRPEYAEVHNDLGTAFYEIGRFDEAAASYRTALELIPDLAEAHLNSSHLMLLQGDFQHGWPKYEWRLKTGNVRVREFPQPRWDGQPLNGRTILLRTEQGLGDTIQFIRYAPLVKSLGGIVVGECRQSLVRLLATCQGLDRLIGYGEALPSFDFHVPLQSLPAIFNTTVDTIPAGGPYLFANPALAAKWRERLADVREFRIGISWHGRAGHGIFRRRDIPLKRFASIAQIRGIRLISLQQGEGRNELAAAGFPIFDPGDDVDTASGPFMDTAAIMMNLDLVISSDTSTPHLAGALGVPVWLALPFAPDWRWLLDRSDSPWYPTMRLFRQKERGDWTGVFSEIDGALHSWLNAKNVPD